MKHLISYICTILIISLTLSTCSNTNYKQVNNSGSIIKASELITSSWLIENIEIIDDENDIYGDLSLPSLKNENIVWSDLILEEILSSNSFYTRYRIWYKNNDIYLSWIMNIPKWELPFPLLVLNHWYIDTRYYTNWRWLIREQDYFAKNGYAVIHPDYRNHAYSDKISIEKYDFRLWYTRDVIAAIYAVQNSDLDELDLIDTTKIWMLWHSMWSWISQNIAVVKPDLVKAIVLYWPVSNNEYLNFEKFQLSNPERSSRVQQVLEDYKTPEENPTFWEWVSSKSFIRDINTPIIIFTWTNDKDTPTKWAQDIATDLKSVWKDVEIISYNWESHEFINKWPDFMSKSKDFFDENL